MTVILQAAITGESGEEWSTLDCYTEYNHIDRFVVLARTLNSNSIELLFSVLASTTNRSIWVFLATQVYIVIYGRRGSFSVGSCMLGKLSRGTNLNDNSDCQRFGQRLWASSGQIAKKLVRVLSIDRHAQKSQSVKNVTSCFMLGLYSNTHIIKHIMYYLATCCMG